MQSNAAATRNIGTMFTAKDDDMRKTVTISGLAAEPFRLFFPLGVLAGILGVALWPLHLLGVTEWYPGLNHARLMGCGFIGSFIFGFLGTAMPRMLSATPFRPYETLGLIGIQIAAISAYGLAKVFLGDVLFLTLLLGFLGCVAVRVSRRKDLPPPGFVLVGAALLCALAGMSISLIERFREIDLFWNSLQRLLLYQGFILLPILGIGPFLLPRFFGMQSAHDFPEARTPSPAWSRKAFMAIAVGGFIIGSFFIEAIGWLRSAYAVRFSAVLFYLWKEMPFHRAPAIGNPLGLAVRLSFFGILAGFLAIAIFPGYRVGLLHVTLAGGFAVIVFAVATRVVFGHSGNLALLKKRNRWLLVAIGLMLFGMATRISGDFWPKIMASHYNYGAILWIIGVLLWSFYVLPKVLIEDREK